MSRPATKSNSAPTTESGLDMGRSRFPVWLMAALLALVTIAVYWPATRCDFINYDDDLYVTANAHIQNGLTLAGLKWAFFKPDVHFGYWHPLTLLSHMVDCQLFGLQFWGHHLTSLLLHALNTLLVFLLLGRLTGALWRSLLAAALFGVHPLHVESVAWVAERKDVLSALFFLLTLLAYARYTQSQVPSPKSQVFDKVSGVGCRVTGEQNPKPEGRNPKETRNPNPDPRGQGYAACRLRFDVGRWKFDVGGSAFGAGLTHEARRLSGHASRITLLFPLAVPLRLGPDE